MRSVVAVILLASALPAAAQQPQKPDSSVARGRYLVGIAGCNDCHTPNFAPSGGKVAEAEWLTGDALGWRGPWGTTYAPNLRLSIPGLTEDEWVKKAKTLSTRPPMPWFNLNRMSEQDLRAVYRYVRHLGPAGKPAPEYVPPDKTPARPYFQFVD
jgi:mono/diheme cytochrome c family protein